MKISILILALFMLVHSVIAAAAPDEDILGKARGYPIGNIRNHGTDESMRVGSQSNMDKIFPVRTLEKSARPAEYRQGKLDPAFRYHPLIMSASGVRTDDASYSIEEYLQHQRVTGLMVIKDGEILFEGYQYDRTPAHRFVSHSMAKSITSLALGFAVEEGKIQSLDDKASKYVKNLAGYAYGETSIRNLLRMASGVKFTEDYSGGDDLARFIAIRAEKGLVAALQAFNQREAPEGTRFHYATSETYLLGLIVSSATGRPLADYVAEKIWKPMGAEVDAAWIVDPQGYEYAGSSFNAVLRDYGRLGMLLAADGMVNGVQVLPKEYLMEATDWHRHPEAFHPGKATSRMGYGYQFWLMPGAKRRFGLMGIRGQFIYVDPESRLVLVQTAVARNASVFKQESMGFEFTGLWLALLRTYGKQ